MSDDDQPINDKGAWAAVLLAEAAASGRTRYNPANINDDVSQATKYRQKQALADNGLIETRKGSGQVKLTDRAKQLRDKIVANGFPGKLLDGIEGIETALEELPDDVLDDNDEYSWRPSTRDKLTDLKNALEQLQEQNSSRGRY